MNEKVVCLNIINRSDFFDTTFYLGDIIISYEHAAKREAQASERCERARGPRGVYSQDPSFSRTRPSVITSASLIVGWQNNVTVTKQYRHKDIQKKETRSFLYLDFSNLFLPLGHDFANVTQTKNVVRQRMSSGENSKKFFFRIPLTTEALFANKWEI